jgi:predicted phosphodiesterase
MIDKIHRSIYGRFDKKYLHRMLESFPDADVIVFGHLHVPYNLHLDGKLLFNTGSASFPWPRTAPATLGVLHQEQGEEPQGEIIMLD